MRNYATICVAAVALVSYYNPRIAVASLQLTIEDIAKNYFDTLDSALDNEATALENFQTVVNSSSKDEISRGVVGVKEVVLPELESIANLAVSLIPHGEVGKAITEILMGNSDQHQAATSNTLKDYITEYRSKIGRERSAIKTNRAIDEATIRNTYNSLDPAGKNQYYASQSQKLEKLKQKYSTRYNETFLFNNIVQSWINENNRNSSGVGPDYYAINYIVDKDWNAVYAYISGTIGGRLNEQLMKVNPSGVPIESLKIPVEIRWFPEGFHDNSGCGATFDENGRLKRVVYTHSGRNFLHQFALNLQIRGISHRRLTLAEPREKWSFWRIVDLLRALGPFGGNYYSGCPLSAEECPAKLKYPNFNTP